MHVSIAMNWNSGTITNDGFGGRVNGPAGKGVGGLDHMYL